jgi:hypothetical protein
MLLTEFIVNQYSGLGLTSLLVVAALPLNKLENMSKTKVKSRSNCRFLAHPAHSQELRLLDSGAGLVTAALSPSPPTAKSSLAGVPRALDGLVGDFPPLNYCRTLSPKLVARRSRDCGRIFLQCRFESTELGQQARWKNKLVATSK